MVTTDGDPKEKLNYVFDMYDKDNNKVIGLLKQPQNKKQKTIDLQFTSNYTKFNYLGSCSNKFSFV